MSKSKSIRKIARAFQSIGEALHEIADEEAAAATPKPKGGARPAPPPPSDPSPPPAPESGETMRSCAGLEIESTDAESGVMRARPKIVGELATQYADRVFRKWGI